MNKKQRKLIQIAYDCLNQVIEEEEEKLSNMEERFSETQRYMDMEENKDNLQEALDIIDELRE